MVFQRSTKFEVCKAFVTVAINCSKYCGNATLDDDCGLKIQLHFETTGLNEMCHNISIKVSRLRFY